MRALAIENEAARQKALDRYQILDTDPEASFDDLTGLAAQICKTPIALISLTDRDRQWFKSKVGLNISEVSRHLTFCTYAVQHGGPLIVEDALADERFSSSILVTDEPKVRFYAGVPLITPNGYRLGTICVVDHVPRKLGADQLESLKALGRQVVHLLELRRNLTDRQRIESLLIDQKRILEMIATGTDLSTVLNTLIRTIEQKSDGMLGSILLLNPEGTHLRHGNAPSLPRNYFQVADGLAIGANNGSCGRAAFLGKPVIVSDIAHDPLWAEHRDFALSYNLRSCWSTPIFSSTGQVLGTFAMYYREPRSPDVCDQELIEMVVDLAGIAIERQQSEEKLRQDIAQRKQVEKVLRQQTEQERLLMGIANRIRQSLDLDEILNTTVSEVRQFLQTDRVLIYRFEPDWSGMIAVESVDPDWSSILNTRIQDCGFQDALRRQAFEQGHPQANADIYQAGLTPCHVDLLAQFQVRANLAVPILQHNQLWGLLVAHHCSKPRQWQPLEIHLLEQLATQVAIAISQSSLYQQAQTELAERRQAEQKVREQANLLDVATDAIFVHDLNHRIIYWNKGAERLYGWSAEEVNHQPANRLLYRETPINEQDIYRTVLTRGAWQGELRQWTKDEQEITVESRWTLIRNADGQIQAILLVNTDITQKKQLERQFLRAQRMESIGTLAGGIAHDLNNLLAPILLTVPLLEMQFRDPTDPKSRQWLEIVDNSARRGASLVKQVLTFARGIEGERSLLEVKHLIWEIKQIAEETFPKSVTLSTNVPRDLWTVCGDATQLHQILMNLSLNARDAMSSGGTLQIVAQNIELSEDCAQLHIEAQAGSYVKITVSDTGEGISADIMDRIFDPFFTTKEIGRGTGLGLATVMTIVKSHSGFVTVSSEVGKGTEFQIYLPAIRDREISIAQEQEMFTGHGELILLVDDEAAIQQVAKASLEAYNYRVLTACNGFEAIDLAIQHQHDIRLVLVDLMMPSMDGYTTIRELRSLDTQIKVVTMSGLGAGGQSTEELQVQHRLMKPFTTQDLLTIVRQAIHA